LPAGERRLLARQFAHREQRDRIIDVFAAMGRDEAFMRATALAAREHLADKPVLLLYGQFDPMRLIGAVARFRALFRRSSVSIIPGEEHFPILASARRVASAVRSWMDAALGQAA